MLNQIINSTECDPGELNRFIEEVNAYFSSVDLSEFPISSVENLKDALAYAIKVSQKEPCDEAEIDKAKTILNTAYINMKNNKGNTFVLPNIDNIYDTNRGFYHPGGLYTQKDFDRVKKQLKEKNEKVTLAYDILKNAEYAQPDAKTYPTENIVRGGGNGENYINAARGASIAFQNALRWKIEGNELCAKHAIDVLMAWATTTKLVTGDSNYALASGIYGYEFAQAAELMRDYEGWKKEDFEKFKEWMLSVWYPACIRFLRERNST